jgi:hypothetical protein
MIPSDYPYASHEGAKSWQPGPLLEPPGVGPAVSPSAFPLEEPDFAVPKLAVTVAVVIAALSIFNATMMPVTTTLRPSPGFIFGLGYLSLLLGSLGGQAALLTVLVVWEAGPLWLRLVWHWGLALVAFSAWTFGFMVALATEFGQDNFPKEEFLAALLGLPLVALASQAIPWLLKFYFHWRIEHEDYPSPPMAAQRLSIRDMIVGMIVVALTMAAVRAGKPATAEEGIYWAGWMIGIASAAGISLVCLTPMIYFTLGVKRASWGVWGVVAISGLVAAVASGILMYFSPPGPSYREIILMMVMITAGFALTLCGTLWIVRASGYRLATSPPLMSPFDLARSGSAVP